MNARNLLALSSTPANKRRLGFEFNGPPLKSKRADFALDLEYRHIGENAMVNATTQLAPASRALMHRPPDVADCAALAIAACPKPTATCHHVSSH